MKGSRASRVGPATTTRSASTRGGCRIRSARLSGAVLALLVLAGSAAGQDLSRADPVLRYILTRPAAALTAAAAPGAGRRPAFDRGAPSPGPLSAALERGPDGIRVRVLVRVGAGGESALRRAGATIGVRAGDVVTARVPLAAIRSLLGESGIRVMEAAMPLVPLGRVARGPGPSGPPTPLDNDSATLDARFDTLRTRGGAVWAGLAGQGVIVGVYDTGLDVTHDDFLDANGHTRVLVAWDQTDSAGPAPGTVAGLPFTYGSECSAASIDNGECRMVDVSGHGTHVAGIAAGDGSATGHGQPAWRFPGGAPAADLIIVKGGDESFTGDLLVEGVAYIFARARALGRPAVVNLSLAALSQGPHDGTTELERALDALTGPGRIIVAGAGNEGDFRNTSPPYPNGPKHAQGVGSGSHGVHIPAFDPTPEADGLILELWYGGEDSLSVTVTSPRGDVITAATGDSAFVETDGGAMAIANALDGPDPGNGDHGAIIAIGETLAGVLPDTGTWGIDVSADAIHGTGAYHLWLAGSTLDFTGLPPALSGGTTNRYLVSMPASADRIIAVGGHVTRQHWLGLGGEPRTFGALAAPGDIAFMSSPGPRRDGVQKPDITAPGLVLVSSLSKDATLWDANPDYIEADSVHVGLFGTSMASPMAAAAAAILLQLDPELTPDEVRDALRLSAAADAWTGTSLPSPTWGSGKLDVAAAVDRISPDVLSDFAEAVDLSANPVRGDALVVNYHDRPSSVVVYTLVGERVRGFSGVDIGPDRVVWPLDTDAGGDVANGVYVLVVELPDRRVVRKVFVARP